MLRSSASLRRYRNRWLFRQRRRRKRPQHCLYRIHGAAGCSWPSFPGWPWLAALGSVGGYFRLHLSGHLALADVITLTRTAAALETRHKAFRVLPASEASFAQLREGPIVLIGGFDNIWTLRVTQKLRFGFVSKDGVAIIVDRKSPKQTSWATAWDLPYQKLSRDYAIVARIHDNTTGQPVIVAAGISEEGTESAGEILYNPMYLDSLLAKLPANWEKLNMEAVIETQVIEGHPGPPSVLAVETW
jgi:hypothetical protein